MLLNQVIANKKLSTNKKVVTTFKLYEKDALFGLNFSSAKGEATSTKTWKKESNFRIKTGTGNSSNLDINTKGLRNNTYQFHKRINVRLVIVNVENK